MHIIKSISPSSRNYSKIILNNNESYILHNDVIVKYNLHLNGEITDEFLKEIIFENELIKAKSIAYRFASYKPRTTQEIKNKLAESNFSEQIIEKSISFLEKYGLINDERYIANFLTDKTKLKKWGILKIKTELLRKGIDKALIELKLKELFDENFEIENALKQANKKLSTIAHRTDEKRKQSLITYLKYKGFSWEIIKKVLDVLKIE